MTQEEAIGTTALWERELESFRARAEARIAAHTAYLARHMEALYLNAEYRVLKAYDIGSPSIIAIIAAIVNAAIEAYKFVKTLADLLHIAEIIKVGKILYAIWPGFREAVDRVMGRVSEVSEKIGMGVDGLSHLLNVVRSGTGTLAGLFHWSWEERSVASFERVESSLEWLSKRAHAFSDNPGKVLDQIFELSEAKNTSEIGKWWWSVEEFITDAAETAEKAVKKTQEIVKEIESLRNDLPRFVRDHIPHALWDAALWADVMIEQKLLPGIEKMEKTIGEVNAVLDSHRDHINELVDRLKRPGDVMLEIDKLTAEERELQETKIDEVASRAFNKAADKYEEADRELDMTMEKIRKAMEAPTPPPSFMKLEGAPPPAGEIPGEKVRTTWFVGDY